MRRAARHSDRTTEARGITGTRTPTPGTRGGPNLGCTPIAILPVTADAQRAIDTLDAIKALNPESFNHGHTHGYLGALWAARLLDPDWHELWQGQDSGVAPSAPRFPANHVRSIVLLTDGVNESKDPWQTLPGRGAFAADSDYPDGWRLESHNRAECVGPETHLCVLVGEQRSQQVGRDINYSDGPRRENPSPPYWLSDYSALGRLGSLSTSNLTRETDDATREAWGMRHRRWFEVTNEWADGDLDQLMLDASAHARWENPNNADSEAPHTEMYAVVIDRVPFPYVGEVYHTMRACTETTRAGTTVSGDLRTFPASNAEGLYESFATIARGLTSVQRTY